MRRRPVVRTSMFTGRIHRAWLPLTEQQEAARDWGHLPPEWREFCMTGTTPEEWKREFGKVRTADFDGEELHFVRIERIG